MIDSMQAFMAPNSAQSTAVKSSTAASSRSAEEGSGFGDVLAQSSERAAAGVESVTAGETSMLVPGKKPDIEDEADIIRSDTVDSADLAALMAQVAAENLPALLPMSSQPSVQIDRIVNDTATAGTDDTAGVLRGASPAAVALPVQTPEMVVAPAVGAIAFSPVTRSTTKATAAVAIAPGATANSTTSANSSSAAEKSGLPVPVAEEPPGPQPALPTVQAASADLDTPRARAADVASREGLKEGPATGNAMSTGSKPVRSMEFQSMSATTKTDDPRQPAAHQMEPAQVANIMAGAAAHITAANGPSPAMPAAILLVPTHIESPAWSKDFGQHVIRLAVEGQPAAEIHLNPPNLGPISVSIEIKGQDAVLQFVAAHPQTRDVLENALPRLREMFSGGGLTLSTATVAGAHVASESFSPHAGGSHGQRFDQSSSLAKDGQHFVVEDAAPVAIAARPYTGRSRVDLFA